MIKLLKRSSQEIIVISIKDLEYIVLFLPSRTVILSSSFFFFFFTGRWGGDVCVGGGGGVGGGVGLVQLYHRQLF